MSRSEKMTGAGFLGALGAKGEAVANQTPRVIRAADLPEIDANASDATLFFVPGLLASALILGVGRMVTAFERFGSTIGRIGVINKGLSQTFSPTT